MKKVGTSVNPADLMTKPMPRPKIEQLMNIMGYEFVEHFLASRSTWYEIGVKFDASEGEARELGEATAK